MEEFIYIIKLIAYFIVYSFIGWVMESTLKTILQKKPVNSGFLYGPFCPIYGFGAIIMFLFLNRFKDNIILLFIVSFVVLSIWEYLVGWLLEKIFHTKYWDYTENRFNIKGRVCLLNSLIWGFLGVLFTKIVHPYIMERIDAFRVQDLIFFTVILLIIIIVDTITSIVKVNTIKLKLEKLKEITNAIKEKLEELETKQISKENIQDIIEDLKYKQTKIKRKLLRQTNRLKKAFPTMKSDIIEKMNDFLKERKDIIKEKSKLIDVNKNIKKK